MLFVAAWHSHTNVFWEKFQCPFHDVHCQIQKDMQLEALNVMKAANNKLNWDDASPANVRASVLKDIWKLDDWDNRNLINL